MTRRLTAILATALALVAIGAVPASAAVPKVNHVFIIVLENENADSSFGPDTQIPYLAQTLTSQGAYVPDYYGTGHLSLDNYISMVSGQAPNAETQADCQFFTEFLPGVPTSDGQFIGQGCVYPPGVQTIASQLDGAGYTWKGYMQDMGADPVRDNGTSCAHPAINAHDGTQQASATDQYATRHNPFVYFHSIIDFPAYCQAHDVNLDQLPADLAATTTTPNYSFITPDLCNDGHDEPCVTGEPGGMTQANSFLQDWVPRILNSPAYGDRGLLIVTFDEAEGEPPGGDASACCNEQPGPNTINAGGPIPGSGGGRIGAVMVSPCINPGTVTDADYNHYSLLRSIEDNFGLPHLGYAGQAGLAPFGEDILNKPTCGQTTGKQKKPKKT